MKHQPSRLRNSVSAAALCSALVAAAALAADNPALADKTLIERGQQLLATHGCHDCHTPLKMGQNGPEPDMSQMPTIRNKVPEYIPPLPPVKTSAVK